MGFIVLRGPDNGGLPEPSASVTAVRVPGGIGDISWIWSKLSSLPGPIWFAATDGEPRRAHQLVELLPEARWCGYDSRVSAVQLFADALPASAEPADLNGGQWRSVSCNQHLEDGRPLSGWMPSLPTDYHYPIRIPKVDQRAAELLLKVGKPEPQITRWVSVYISNRDKERYPQWAIWGESDWLAVLKGLRSRLDCGFVFVGADYDRDKTEAIADWCEQINIPVRRVIGRTLGTALEAMKKCCWGIWYPSGIGILANVLRLPGVMLLPRHLTGLERTYADPDDIRAGRYRAWTAPSPQDILAWFDDVGSKHVEAGR